jgi:hypothetical protein
MTSDPLTMSRLRGGRDDGRATEDDAAKGKLGEQGLPGKKPKTQVIDDDTLQNPKTIDPGHTA